MSWTAYDDLNEVLRLLVSNVRALLAAKLIGIYLQGSFAVGDFDEHSDCDFIVVLSEELSAEEVAALNAMHERIYAMREEWAKHLEGSYFTLDEIAGAPGPDVWYLDHGHTKLERSNHCNTLVVRWTLEHYGILLHVSDPPAPPRGWGSLSEAIPHVQTHALRAEIKNTLITWGKAILADPTEYRNRFYQGFIVLNYCRMLHDFSTGRIGSKKQGADWAKQNLDEKWHGLIDRTWSCRPNPSLQVRTPPSAEDLEATLEFVQLAIDAVTR